MRRRAPPTRALPFRTNDAVAQVLRLLETWWSREWQATTDAVLAHWFSSTAARGSSMPRADIAMAMADHLALFSRQRTGALTAVPALARISPSMRPTLMRTKIAAVVFDQMLASEVLAPELIPVFSWLQVRTGLPTVEWAAVPPEARNVRGWIWLQQLGLGEHVDERFIADERISTLVAEVPRDRVGVRVTPEELDRRLALQRQRGEMAEEFVVVLERKRLRAGGAASLSEEVARVSTQDVAAGYDIRSFELNGEPRHIEVKSSAGPRDMFILSDNEAQTARTLGRSYWLAWVGWSIRLPDGPCDVAMFRNLGALLARPPNAWRCEQAGWIVHRVADDSELASQ